MGVESARTRSCHWIQVRIEIPGFRQRMTTESWVRIAVLGPSEANVEAVVYNGA